jgi:hypothetical protein
MNRYLRLLFLSLVTFLALVVGTFANESVRYIAQLPCWSSISEMHRSILIIAIVCLVLGAVSIFRLVGSHFDSIKTWFWLIIGSILTGLGVGLVIGDILLLMRSS